MIQRLAVLLVAFLGISHLAYTQESIDYRSWQSPVKSQANRGTCSAFAIAAALETLPGFPVDLSEQALYTSAKLNGYFDTTEAYSEGAFLSYYLPVLRRDGVVREAQSPYQPEAPIWKSGSRLDSLRADIAGGSLYDALSFRKHTYRVEQEQAVFRSGADAKEVDWIQQQLRNGVHSIPVGYAINANQWMRHKGTTAMSPGELFVVVSDGQTYGYTVAKLMMMDDLIDAINAGKATLRFKNEEAELNGGHAVCIVGYDAEGFIFKNSWGTQWGENGYGRISYELHRILAVQVLNLAGGQVISKPDAHQTTLAPETVFLKSLPAANGATGVQLSLVFQSEQAPPRLQNVSYQIHDGQGRLLKTVTAPAEQATETGYNAQAVRLLIPATNSAVNVQVRAILPNGQIFTNTYSGVRGVNQEYAPD